MKNLIIFLFGLMVGWATITVVRADWQAWDIREVISLLEKIERNTRD